MWETSKICGETVKDEGVTGSLDQFQEEQDLEHRIEEFVVFDHSRIVVNAATYLGSVQSFKRKQNWWGLVKTKTF